MATTRYYDESLVERDEVLFPTTDVIDTEPYYDNFTAIQNTLRQYGEERQVSAAGLSRSYSSDDQYRAIRTEVEPSSPYHYRSNESLYMNRPSPSSAFTVPVNIRSKKIDGHIFNLTQIMEEIGYNRNTLFIRSSPSPTMKNVSALLDIVLKMGGAQGPLVNVWRSRLTDESFEKWYLEKYHQRSASVIQHNIMSNISEATTQNSRARDYQSNVTIDHLLSPRLSTRSINMDRPYDDEVKQVYEYDDIDRASSVSSQSSYSEIELKSNHQRSPSLTSILKKNNNNQQRPNGQTKRNVTIREHHSMEDLSKAVSSSSLSHQGNDQRVLSGYHQLIQNHPDVHMEDLSKAVSSSALSQQGNDQRVLSEYHQLIQNHPDVHNDPNPEIITKPNPEQFTYQQNVSVRYLVPPTPPPPGPLIIREILPPRAPSPPPLVVKYQEPSPPTPPPLVLREAPPPPPPHQETTVITKVLPAEPPSARRVIVEHTPPPPPKPQPIIIEKWLPYKPAPPREVIYERVTEKSTAAEFEPATTNIERQRRHSAEFQANSTAVEIPVQTQRRNSAEFLNTEHVSKQSSKTFDELAWTTHQQILAMQQRGRQQLQASQQWAANQWQQHANMFLQYPTQLTTPTLIVYHPPVTRTYVQAQEYRQQIQYNHPTVVYPFF